MIFSLLYIFLPLYRIVSGTTVIRINTQQGTILSPNFPDPSPSRQRFLYYIIQVPGALRFNFSINFFCTEENKDFLFYGNGTNPSLQAFPATLGVEFLNGCFNETMTDELPMELILEGDSAWFRFDTDRNIPSPGFNITYTIVGNPPIITCPEPVFIESLENDIGNNAVWPNPTCTGIDRPDPSTLQIECTPELGVFFLGLGPNTATCTCTDNLGASDSCDFEVTITPFPVNAQPVINCPDDVTVASLPGDVGNTASWSPPICTDVDQTPGSLQVSSVRNPVISFRWD
ncbi:hypothetical protein BSL78_08994 [Apostichopus japonicus]|uniref:CUB domain-containing protein n=1 Tax=Stichopus japonicus TaxID=307972 RepID=A0A2G8L1N3_STIJA|nr:hypothetical protein BSL78_08994 [Apostichopus japonicus]